MLINVKMPTIVDILTFMSRINFVLRLVEQEKSFITSRSSLSPAMYASIMILQNKTNLIQSSLINPQSS